MLAESRSRLLGLGLNVYGERAGKTLDGAAHASHIALADLLLGADLSEQAA